ncbi:MAG: putative quinol monooxygenase [Moraxellaceae bacterium]
MQPKVVVFGFLRFPPDKLEEIRPHLKAFVEATYKNDDCIAYDVAEDPFDLGLIRFSELWPNPESLSRHLQAPHLEPWRAIARSCGLLDRKFTAYSITDSWSV